MSVVTKISRRVQIFIIGLARAYVAEGTMHVMMSVMKSFFDIIYQLCVNVNLSLTDLDTGNVGVENENGQNFVVIPNTETGNRMPHTDDK